MATTRRKPYSLHGEPTAETVERIDEMLEILYRLISEIAAHRLLSDLHSDTRPDPEFPNPQRGDIITGQGTIAAPDRIAWSRLALGDANTVLHSNGEDAEWTQVNLDPGGDVEGILPVENGGTERDEFDPYAVVTGGTTSTGPLQQVAGLGTLGQVLTSQGTGTLPTWEDNASSGTDHVIMLTGAEPGQVLTDGFGGGIYIPYTP